MILDLFTKKKIDILTEQVSISIRNNLMLLIRKYQRQKWNLSYSRLNECQILSDKAVMTAERVELNTHEKALSRFDI